MKRYVCLALVLFSFYLAPAQTNFGIKAGYNSSSVQITNGTDWDSKSGIHAGGLAHIHVTSHFAVQPEIMISCQRGQMSDDNKLRLTYINVPVLAQYMVSDGFRLQTGPQIGFLVSAEQKIGNIEVDVDDAFDAVDASWIFGAGYIFTSGFGIDARFNLGLNNISDDEDFKAKNRVFQLGLFYQFRNNAGRKK